MFAHDPSSLQEAEIAEVEPFAEAVYDGYNGYAEAEPFAGYGGYGEFMPSPAPFLPQVQIRPIWSPQFGRMMPHRWDLFQRRWVPHNAPSQYGPPPGWHQGSTPPARRVYMRCNVWPGPAGLVPMNAGQPGAPGMPMPGMPGYPGMPGMPGAGGGGRRRRRRRR
jgi:hypothetical protein